MKKVLMIHEWKDEFKKLPLEDYILTFDDGLYTQYEALEYLKTLDTQKIFFISTGIVCEENQSKDFITCSDAHKKAFKGNNENYMSWEQIKEIQDTENCEIGGHSHYHKHLQEFKSLKAQYLFITADTNEMIKTFAEQDIYIDKFCFPYNYEDGLVRSTYESFQFELYGNERIPIESL